MLQLVETALGVTVEGIAARTEAPLHTDVVAAVC
jgi:acyl CoA:acetate/3-ketoacid CoA transferase beta subunit